jgi:hypothetical protein
MSRIKRLYEEIERVNDIINGLIISVENSDLFDIEQQMSIVKTLNTLFEENEDKNIRDLVIKYLEPVYEDLHSGKNDSNSSTITTLIRLSKNLKVIKTILNYPEHFSPKAINSEKYYNDKISELESREMNLKEILNSTQIKSKNTEQIQLKLDKVERELKERKNELQIKEKQEDAKNNWETKINTTFSKLKNYLEPIEKEKSRLNILYYAYLILSILTLIIIIAVECIAIYKITSQAGFPNLTEYLIIYLPIPITGLLMWGFVFQMNRAQRQLIIIANKIHSTNYIQGLLISINNLSPNLEDGITRINNAIDKIIANHLNNNYIKNESELIKEEKKDNTHTDEIIKILKGAKEIYK